MSDLFKEIHEAEVEAKQKALLENPAILDGALPRFKAIFAEFDELMRSNHIREACELEDKADALALELWGERLGCMDAMDLLAESSAAELGTVPLWGQKGDFIHTLLGPGCNVRVRFEYHGIYGIGGPLGFAIHAVDFDKPFFTETGYRSFLGNHGLQSIPEGLSVAEALGLIVLQWHKRENKGKLRNICMQYRHSPRDERWYVIECGTGKPLADFDGYTKEVSAQSVAACLRAKHGKNEMIRAVGPYTREAFLSMMAHDGWAFRDGAIVPAAPDRSTLEYCRGCGDPVTECSCDRCEECREKLEFCECDETTDAELEADELESVEPVAVTPIAAEPEQLSLF